METLKGIPASPGIYIGKAFLYLEEKINITRYKVEPDHIKDELERLDKAFEDARNDLENLKVVNSGIMTSGESFLIDTHIMMLSDPDFRDKIDKYLKKYKVNAEAAVYTSIKEYIGELSLSTNTYAKERISDFRDIARRVLGRLTSRCLRNLTSLKEECVVVSRDSLPSDAIVMDKTKVKGIVLEAGGRTSHTAIIARAFNIPAVLGVQGILEKANRDCTIIVDGYGGNVVIDPDKATIEAYIETLEKNHQIAQSLRRYIQKVAQTDDGRRVFIKANIEFPEEIENVEALGTDGVGLFRSEFLLMQNEYQKDEEKQFAVYKNLLERANGQPVTIRTLDIGGDKMLSAHGDNSERNPLLGWRGIRYSLTEQDMFICQLRALYRASVFGSLKIMFPMIATMEELEAALEIAAKVRASLKDEGYKINEEVPIGMMMEVPSAALAADAFAEKVAFFSIGSNDLIQYTMAMDRGNERVAYLYQPFNPAILRLLKMVIDAGKKHDISVSVCGEIAADPLCAIVLLGMEIDELSMSSQSISVIKKVIRNVLFTEAKETVADIMKLENGTKIYEYLRTKYNDRFGIYL